MANRQPGEDQPMGIPTTDYSKGAGSSTGAPIGIPTGKDDAKPKALDAQGAVGKQFTAEEGVIGGTANKIGGPLAKDGIVGKQFTTEGSIGGTIQSAMGGTKKTD
ncbi:hypothetical protein MAPG_05643 [Magnaporthiopsis poae ATCC 64411]|uniref:Uncharacterized protein n=1 Tax=Magnaporthiopsis poae (strain ATCC 64411 / 73-15) TaxID=644358 RepID=A0A0C4DZY0_MAGP6|nr:hypothetical protein MAPG_05643 [Magnaporthiopsis poae ATCC 64411]